MLVGQESKPLLTPAVQWLMRETRSLDPYQAIRKEALQLLGEDAYKEPPIKLTKIAQRRRVIAILKEDNLDSEGVTIPDKRGFVIKLKKNSPSLRQRYTLAHEIAHTFFFNRNVSPPKRQYWHSLRGDIGEEYLCERGAAEILMPFPIFKRYIKIYQIPSISALSSLQAIFQVSTQASACRILQDIGFWQNIIIIETRWRPCQFSGKNPALRINWVVKPRKLHYYIPTNKRIKQESSIFTCYTTGSITNQLENLELGDLKGKYQVESIKSASRKVVSIIKLSNE